MAALAEQVSAFKAQLPQIRQRYGSVWAVFLDNVKATFPSFNQAVDYADDHLGDADYVIRHTYEEPEFAAFIMVEQKD